VGRKKLDAVRRGLRARLRRRAAEPAAAEAVAGALDERGDPRLQVCSQLVGLRLRHPARLDRRVDPRSLGRDQRVDEAALRLAARRVCELRQRLAGAERLEERGPADAEIGRGGANVPERATGAGPAAVAATDAREAVLAR